MCVCVCVCVYESVEQSLCSPKNTVGEERVGEGFGGIKVTGISEGRGVII